MMSARNETTGIDYQKGNVIRLLNAELEHGYDHNRGWAGYKQWLGAGRVVRKGEHGTACMTVVAVEGADGKRGTRPRGFRVFHYDQTTELEAVETATDEAAAPAQVDEAPGADAMAQAKRDHAELVRRATQRAERAWVAETTTVPVTSRAALFGMVRDPGEDMADRWAESNY